MAKPQRAFAFIAAVLFFTSSVAVSALVIWQATRDDPAAKAVNQEDIPADVLEQLKAQQQAQPEGENVLKGTKLANFTPVSEVPELQIIDLQPGTGAEVPQGGTVVAHYTGALAKDGTIFESSKDGGQPAEFSLSGVIQGWQQGVPGMKVGGTRRLIIPAALAYGEAGSPPTIGPNEPLVFDIELVNLGQ